MFMLFVGAAGANNSGYLTTGTQTIAGIKTLSSRVKALAPADASVEFGSSNDRGFLSGDATTAVYGFGAYTDGTNYYARKTAAGTIQQTGTSFVVTLNSGLTIGNTFTPTTVLTVTAVGVAIGAGAVGGRVTIPAGSATAGTCPIKFTTGSLMTTPEALALECLSGALYWTPSSARERLFSGPALVVANLAPGTINAGTVWESSAITVPGAAANDPVIIGAPAAIEAGILWCGYVSATGFVKVRLANPTGGNIPVATQDFNVTVLH